MALLRKLFLLVIFTPSLFAATGSWNGVAITAINGVAQTAWNGTSISCAGGGGGGPDVYYWSVGGNDSAYPTGPSSTFYTMHTDTYGAGVAIATDGAATKLAIQCNSASGTINVKLAIYDASFNRVSSGTADIVAVGTGTAWYEVTLATPVAVSAATYYVFWSSADTNLRVFYNTSAAGKSKAGVYASFPPSSISSPSDEGATQFAAKIYVD